MNPPAIRTRGLRRAFGEHVAVDSLDLEVPAGSVFAFLGPNGAGKTTTIRMLLGLLWADQGTVELFGAPLRPGRSGPLRAVGALVETPSLYPHLSGRENLRLTGLLLGVPPDRVDSVLDTVGLTQDAHRTVGAYSLGMRQRLGLALALLGAPSLLLLDEPLNGLDPEAIHEMRELLRRLPAQGVTIFLSSHLLTEVEQVATDVAILRRGRLLFQGAADQLAIRSRSRLRLGVARAREAAEALRAAGWEVVEEGEDLQVDGAGREDAPGICRHLVEGGFDLHHLAEERASLESAFLERLRGEE